MKSRKYRKRIVVVSRELARRKEANTERKTENDLPSRLEWATSLLENTESSTLESGSDDLEVLRYHFSDKVIPADTDWKSIPISSEESPTTDLNAVLKQIADKHRNDQIDAAFLLTDAIHSVDGSPIQIPPGLREFPLYLVPTGSDYKLSDLTLWRVSAPTSINKGDFVNIECLVGARGYLRQIDPLELLEEGAEIDSVEVTFQDDGEDQKVRLSTRIDSPGSHRFEVELAPSSRGIYKLPTIGKPSTSTCSPGIYRSCWWTGGPAGKRDT